MRTIPTRTGNLTPVQQDADRPAGPPPAAGTASSGSLATPVSAPTLDPVVARALFAAWSGDPAVVVASPPGAGKTRLVTHLAREMSERAGLRVAIAAQTRAQALDVATRAGALSGKVALLGKSKSERPRGLPTAVSYCPGGSALRPNHRVVVATTARWQWTSTTVRADVLIVDEAWQMTFADLGALGVVADQVVLVGDPGQIAPVVTGEVRRWAALPTGPHQPAPTALIAAHPDSVTRLQLPHTWRLGPQTTALVQPVFYPELPFISRRPPRTITTDGDVQPEIVGHPVAVAAGRADPSIVSAAVDRVRQLLHGGHVVTEDGTSPLGPHEVALIVPHVDQASAAAAQLTDVPEVLVGTINQAQGLEREAVVAIHPLAGYRETPAFAVDPGRLCVAMSRHRAHLTVVVDQATPLLVHRARTDDPQSRPLRVQALVLDALTT